jgi:hypothetical protein
MKVLDPWQTISNMAHEARENGGYATLPTPDGHRLLKLWRMGPVTRFFIGAAEVSGSAFADEVCAQFQAGNQQENERGLFGVGGFIEGIKVGAADLSTDDLAEVHGVAYFHSSGCVVLKNGTWLQPEQWQVHLDRMINDCETGNSDGTHTHTT